MSWAGSGGTRNALTKEMIESLNVRAPIDVNEQHVITHILGTLDDKIELNRRMNETLEAMARALFKSWFVDFDPVRAKMEGPRHRPAQAHRGPLPRPAGGFRVGRDTGGVAVWDDPRYCVSESRILVRYKPA